MSEKVNYALIAPSGASCATLPLSVAGPLRRALFFTVSTVGKLGISFLMHLSCAALSKHDSVSLIESLLAEIT